jgi:hypothetical protein
MVRPQFLDSVGKPGFFFCPTRQCSVVYHHPEGQLLRKSDLRLRVGLKESEDPIPLCYCFGFTEAMLAQDLKADGSSSIPRRIAAELKAGNCTCEMHNPQGVCCLANVNEALKRLKSARPETALGVRTRKNNSLVVGAEPGRRLVSLIAIIGVAIFAAAELIQPFYRSDRPLSAPYSTYASGKYGFVQTVAFLALSSGSFSLVLGLSRFGGSGSTWRWGRILLGIWSTGVLFAAIFPLEGPVPESAYVHSIASMVSFLAIPSAMLVLSQAFTKHERWRTFGRFSWPMALVALASFFMAATIPHPLCFALLQRVFLASVVCWICGAAFGLFRPSLS